MCWAINAPWCWADVCHCWAMAHVQSIFQHILLLPLQSIQQVSPRCRGFAHQPCCTAKEPSALVGSLQRHCSVVCRRGCPLPYCINCIHSCYSWLCLPYYLSCFHSWCSWLRVLHCVNCLCSLRPRPKSHRANRFLGRAPRGQQFRFLGCSSDSPQLISGKSTYHLLGVVGGRQQFHLLG